MGSKKQKHSEKIDWDNLDPDEPLTITLLRPSLAILLKRTLKHFAVAPRKKHDGGNPLQRMKSSNKGEARNIKDRQPFCWQEKKALEKIRRLFEKDTGSTLLTYLALSEIASDAKAETFPASAGHIAAKAVLARRTIIRRIAALEEHGFITVKRTKLIGSQAAAANIYTLLKVK